MRSEASEQGLATVLVCTSFLLTVFGIVHTQIALGTDASDPLATLPLLALFGVGLISVVSRPRDALHHPGPLALMALASLLSVSYALHPPAAPSQLLLLGVWGAWAISFAVSRLPARSLKPIGTIVVGVGCFEALLAVLEQLSNRSVGFYWLGENPRPFSGSGGPEGTLIHSYVLAALALLVVAGIAADGVGRDVPLFASRWSIAIAGLAAMPVGLTTSRAGALGLFAVCISLAASARNPAHRSRALALLVAIAIGAGLAALFATSGWRARVQQSTTPSSIQFVEVTGGRLPLLRQGLHLLVTHPAFGVGPGRYVAALEHQQGNTSADSHSELQPVHNVPLLAGAEGGVGALLVCVALLVVVGRRAWRHGPATAGLFAALVPYFLLDKLLYDLLQGAVIFGLWVGLLDYFCSEARRQPGIAMTAGTHPSAIGEVLGE